MCYMQQTQFHMVVLSIACIILYVTNAYSKHVLLVQVCSEGTAFVTISMLGHKLTNNKNHVQTNKNITWNIPRAKQNKTAIILPQKCYKPRGQTKTSKSSKCVLEIIWSFLGQNTLFIQCIIYV